MVTQPYWINPNLAIVPRPRGAEWLDDEMRALRQAGIDTVVSMLEPYEAGTLGLEHEAAAAEHAGLRFVNFPIPDRSLPASLEEFNILVDNLQAQIARGRRIGIHCRACIGRSSVLTASLLIRSGASAKQAWKQISEARGTQVPDTPEQRDWVERNIGRKVA
ncbi:MAG TPA: hypothetical protein VG714_01045 [Acidobacteriaceae bacterium]|nr:hypothetical protein [Acidobacteriaceae bacterium]